MRIQAQCLRIGDIIVRKNGVMPLAVTECVVTGPWVKVKAAGWHMPLNYSRETVVSIEAR